MLLVGCGPAPTPFPVTPILLQVPTDAAPDVSPIATQPPVQYGVLPNAADDIPPMVATQPGIELTVIDTAQDPNAYDILTGYGQYDGWQLAPAQPPPVALGFDRTVVPLDNAAVWDAVQIAISPSDVLAQLSIPGAEALHSPAGDVAQARSLLANAGFPDGVTVYGVIVPAPGVGQVVAQLDAARITFVRVPAGTPNIHLMLGPAPDIPLTREQYMPLYRLPLSYRATTERPLTFTETGWPLIRP